MASEALREIISGCPQSPMIPFAASMLNSFCKGYDEKLMKKTQKLQGAEDDFSISCYPNPFNPVTSITFRLPADSYTELAIYNMLGRKISVIASGNLKKGDHTYQWNASNYSSGVYFYVLSSGNIRHTGRMMLVK